LSDRRERNVRDAPRDERDHFLLALLGPRRPRW
jgi:hypothetical protein